MQEEATIAGENYVVKKARLLFLTNSDLPCHDVCSSVVVSEDVNTIRFASLLCLPEKALAVGTNMKGLGSKGRRYQRIRC